MNEDKQKNAQTGNEERNEVGVSTAKTDEGRNRDEA
jgi:hypothetical protein